MTTTTNAPEPTRTFTGLWLPRDIIEAPGLNWIQKLLWAEIYALHSEQHGGCFASNAYLARVFGQGEGTIANGLTALRESGWLVDIAFDGRCRVMRAVYAPFKPVTALHAIRPAQPSRKRPEAAKQETTPLLTPPEELIYQAYPRKVQKTAALKAIRKALKIMEFDELLKKVENYATLRQGKEVQYTPYPATFFNSGEYNDHDHDTATIQPNLW